MFTLTAVAAPLATVPPVRVVGKVKLASEALRRRRAVAHLRFELLEPAATSPQSSKATPTTEVTTATDQLLK